MHNLQRGNSLVETLVALGLLGGIGISFLTALASGSTSANITGGQATARNLAQVQLEDTKRLAYVTAPTTYPTTVPPPKGYSVSCEALAIPDTNDDVQRLRVTVYRGEDILLVAENLKVNR